MASEILALTLKETGSNIFIPELINYFSQLANFVTEALKPEAAKSNEDLVILYIHYLKQTTSIVESSHSQQKKPLFLLKLHIDSIRCLCLSKEQKTLYMKNSLIPYLLWKVFGSWRTAEHEKDHEFLFNSISKTLDAFESDLNSLNEIKSAQTGNNGLVESVKSRLEKLAVKFFGEYFASENNTEQELKMRVLTMKDNFAYKLELEPHMPNWRNFTQEKEPAKHLLSLKKFYRDSNTYDLRAELFERL